MELSRVTSARAAEIVGVGYEGFRSYLKRGILGRVGMLPGFHAPGAGTSDDPAPRSGWQTFDATSLCLMRLAKLLMDSGFSFAMANSVVSKQDLWSRLQHDDQPVDRLLLLWEPYGDHIIFEPCDHHLLPQRVAELHGVLTLINLGDIQREIAEQLGPVGSAPRGSKKRPKPVG
jgi:hypothetical protein